MNIRDITEGPNNAWQLTKALGKGAIAGAGPGVSNAGSNLKKVFDPSGTAPTPGSGGPTMYGAAKDAWDSEKPGGSDKTPSKKDKKEPNQNLEYLKLQSAIMKDKKLTPEQKLEKLDQLLQQQIQQGGR